ncbi:hypothetical protein AVEN_237148-1, partial [Araneus ventricosus]
MPSGRVKTGHRFSRSIINRHEVVSNTESTVSTKLRLQQIKKFYFLTKFPPSCLGTRGPLNGSRCNSSSTEAGVLVAITCQDPSRRKYVLSLEEVTRPPPLLYSQEKQDPAYLSGASHP